MKKYLLIVLSFLPLAVFAQKEIGKSKSVIKKELQASPNKHSLKETDSTLQITNTATQLTRTYGFDSNGNCQFIKVSSKCRSCYEKEMNLVLSQSSFQWKKINENQQVSRFEDQLLLESSPEDDQFFFVIFKAAWTREMYDMLKAGNR